MHGETTAYGRKPPAVPEKSMWPIKHLNRELPSIVQYYYYLVVVWCLTFTRPKVAALDAILRVAITNIHLATAWINLLGHKLSSHTGLHFLGSWCWSSYLHFSSLVSFLYAIVSTARRWSITKEDQNLWTPRGRPFEESCIPVMDVERRDMWRNLGLDGLGAGIVIVVIWWSCQHQYLDIFDSSTDICSRHTYPWEGHLPLHCSYPWASRLVCHHRPWMSQCPSGSHPWTARRTLAPLTARWVENPSSTGHLTGLDQASSPTISWCLATSTPRASKVGIIAIGVCMSIIHKLWE